MKTHTAIIGAGAFIWIVATPMIHSAEVRINSISEKRDGAKVDWSNTEEGYAYTLQERSSLTEGDWNDTSTRYYWPITADDWSVLGIDDGPFSERFFRVVAEPVQTPERGKLLSSEVLHERTLNQVRVVVASFNLPTDDVTWPVSIYKIVYETVDAFGLPITASGALFVPQGVAEPMPVISYQHGTEIYKGSPPSDFDSFPSEADSYYHRVGLFYASAGYVTLMPDYLGLGESPGLHPWLHSKTEATAVVDMLRTAKTFCAENEIELNEQLFLAGYSQGGHATAAAHREIESLHADEFTVTASAPMAGPYDMALSLDHILQTPTYEYPWYFVYVIAAWLPFYEIADTVEELLVSPYDRTLVPRLDGDTTFDETHAAMAPDAQSALDPDFLDALQNDTDHPYWLAAADNSLLDWAPQAPMQLWHCAADEGVPFENATLAHQAYTDNGACCVEVIDPTPPRSFWNHVECYRPSLLGAKLWFDTMK